VENEWFVEAKKLASRVAHVCALRSECGVRAVRAQQPQLREKKAAVEA
jgi:hypothetical protein